MSELVPRDYQLEMFTTVTANYSAAGRLVGSNGSDCNYVLWMDTGATEWFYCLMNGTLHHSNLYSTHR